MKHYLYFLITLVFLVLWSSCRKDFEFIPSTGQLEFSQDTVFLDTIFSNISSSTYTVKVYNRSDDDIVIPSVSLGNGVSSNYRINIDGSLGEPVGNEPATGKIFKNVEILSKDSLFIFIETTVSNGLEKQFLYTDAIEFDTGSNAQKIELVTLVRDAVPIFPNRDSNNVVETLTLDIDGDLSETEVQGRELRTEELNFTNEKAYIIYGFAVVPEGETLTIDAGARIYFHENSGLIISNNASLKVNGTLSADQKLLENEVIFEGDRLESTVSEIPGQWGFIWLSKGSINNVIHYATIKNASIGVLCDGNPSEDKLKITNTKIYNSSNYGILGRNTSITGENIVVNNSGISSFAGTQGGNYTFTHATLVNYWSNDFRQYPAVLLNNFFMDNTNTSVPSNLTANFNNCIIYGNEEDEIELDAIDSETALFNFKFTNCLIAFDVDNELTDPNYNFEDVSKYENLILNQDPLFIDPTLNQLGLSENSAVIDKGLNSFAVMVPNDILGVNRIGSPDLGAYQYVVPEEEEVEN